MPGKEDLMNPVRRRKAGKRILIVLAVLLAGGLAFHGVVEANRFEVPHPTRALPAPDAPAEPSNAFSPQTLLTMVSEGEEEAALEDGTRITLTLDEDLQKSVLALFRRFDPAYGVFAAMEPDTGKVVALVGYRRGGESDPRLPLKAIYPAASLIKVITASAALEKGAVSPEDAISYRGRIYKISRKGLHARAGRGVPSMSLEEAIARSSNAVFGKVAVNYVGCDSLAHYLDKFGFGQPVPFDLPVEASQGEVPRDEYNLARTGAGFGEVYVSPLHMAMIMSAIGNSGEMPRPYLVERLETRDGTTVYEGAPAKWRDTVGPETADTLLQMMVKTIEIGTSRRTFGSPDSTPLLQDMEVAGKTGSLSGWNPPMHFEWFAGVAPAGDPKLALAALVVNDGRARIKGSYVGKEAFNAYFGYPQSTPPAYAKAKGKGKARWRKASKKTGRSKQLSHRKRMKKSVKGKRPSRPVPSNRATSPSPKISAPARNAPLG